MSKKYITTALAVAASCGLFVHLNTIEAADKESCTTTANTGSGEGTVKAQENPQQSATRDVRKLSKAFGHLIGRNLETPGLTFDLECIIQGMRDAAAGLEAPMTEVEYEEAMTSLQEAAFNELAETNLKEANAFLEKNAKEANVVKLEKGKVQYTVLSQGEGKTVKEHGNPTINYRGTYSDGSLFGSSEETGPIALPLDQTISGFAKGLVGMKEGEKRRIYIHPDMGYGVMSHLPPNALLIFDVEIVRADSMGDFEQPVAEGDSDDGEGGGSI